MTNITPFLEKAEKYHGHICSGQVLGIRMALMGLHLLDLILLPAFQQQGLGSALLRAVQAQARQHGAAGVSLYVEMTNPRAMQLYQRLGFVPMAMQGVHLHMLWSPT